MKNTEKVVLHIIGAGPAGISLAYYANLAGVKNINLYEKSNSLGGMARSWKHDDFILDTGPHIYHTDDKEIENDWLNIGNDLLVRGDYSSCNILSNFKNKLFHYPLSLETLKDNLDSVKVREIEDEINQLKSIDNSAAAENFHNFMKAKVGKILTKMFYTDYPQKVWGISTYEMLADWAPQRIELREKNNSFYQKPFVAVGLEGTGCFYERMIDILKKNENFKIFKNMELTGLSKNNEKIKKLFFNKKEAVNLNENDHVFSTIPATNLGKLFDLDLNLKFRGVRSQYLFFKNNRILPKNYNWVYCSDKNVGFNRITEPSTMSKGVTKNGYSFVCVETTFDTGNYQNISHGYEEFISWIKESNHFNSEGYLPELNTQNFEGYVYPIQDAEFKKGLSIYNSAISRIHNLNVIGTGGEFHYSDMQIIFRKSKNLISSFLNLRKSNSQLSIPLIKNIEQENQKKENVNGNNKLLSSKKISSLHKTAKVYIPLIAEIGINHNGDIDLAKKMILSSKKSGAHFAKFQFYKKDVRLKKNSLTEFLHETADYSEMSLSDIFERSRLNLEDCCELINYGKKINMPVFFTVFDIKSAEEISSLGQKMVKVASMDCNNISLHKKLNELDFETIIISTGMTTFSEIVRTLSVYEEKEILLMSCRSSYPARLSDIDLGEIKFLIDNTSKFVGYSDHTEGDHASLLAVAAGATFIERHFTINKNLGGPDNIMSINENEISKLSKNLQLVAESINKNHKIIHPSEQNTFNMQKKSLRFARSYNKDETIHTDDLISQAPPEGFSNFQATLPRTFLKVKINVQVGEPINENNIEIISN